MHIALQETPFDPWQSLADRQQQHEQGGDGARSGATAVFVGTMRDYNEGDDVVGMFLEHYPEMTMQQLKRIAVEAVREWRLDDILILHRVGEIQPADTIVLVAVWSAHRAEAFDACRHVMEILKHSIPFWKKETLVDGATRWVEKNTPG